MRDLVLRDNPINAAPAARGDEDRMQTGHPAVHEAGNRISALRPAREIPVGRTTKV